VGRVGTSQQRLSRELEKIAIAVHPSGAGPTAGGERRGAKDTAFSLALARATGSG
jgi:hypothetical protein